MWTTTLRETTVTLETVGPVRVSLIRVQGDGHIRPFEYLESAFLWGDDEKHCHIVDSNVSTWHGEAAEILFDAAVKPENLARAMHHVIKNVPAHTWEF